MGLFDGVPLTMEEIQLRHERAIAEGHGTGQTIRKLAGGMKPVLRTIRHRPWWEIVGQGPDGKTCGDCRSLVTRDKYFKCGQQVRTRGAGTDIRKKDLACRLFEEMVNDDETATS